MRLNHLIPCLVLVLGASACGGDDEEKDKGGGGTGTVDSGVDGSKPLSMLTDAEVQQIGKSYAESSLTTELIEGTCMFAAVFSASLTGMANADGSPSAEQIMACNDSFNMCKMSAQQAAAQPAPSDGTVPSSASAFAGCNITVDQYETCLTATISMLEQLYAGLSCDKAPSAEEMTVAPESPAECEALAMCSTATAEGF